MTIHTLTPAAGLAGIQHAIDAAAAGDEIHCAAGVFAGDAGLLLRPGISLSGTVTAEGQLLTTLRADLRKPEPHQALLHLENGEQQQICGLVLQLTWQEADFSALTDRRHCPAHLLLQGCRKVQLQQLAAHNRYEHADVLGIYLRNSHAIQLRQAQLSGHDVGLLLDHCQQLDIETVDSGHNAWGMTAWGSQGQISQCCLHNNQEVGLMIQDDSEIHTRRNRAQGNQQAGIGYSASQGSAEDNELLDNGVHGLAIEENSIVQARRNRAQGNQQLGIGYFASQGSAENNELLHNGSNGLEIQKNSIVQARRNRAQGNQQTGIIYSASQGSAEGNVLLGNRAGIAADNQSLQVQSNYLAENDSALLTQYQGELSARDCVLHHNFLFAGYGTSGGPIHTAGETAGNLHWQNGNPMTYDPGQNLHLPPLGSTYPLTRQLRQLRNAYPRLLADLAGGFGSRRAARDWLKSRGIALSVPPVQSGTMFCYQPDADEYQFHPARCGALQWDIHLRLWLGGNLNCDSDCRLLFSPRRPDVWQRELADLTGVRSAYLSLPPRGDLWTALVGQTPDSPWRQRGKIFALALWRALPYATVAAGAAYWFLPESAALWTGLGRLNQHYNAVSQALETIAQPLLTTLILTVIISAILTTLTTVLALPFVLLNRLLLPKHLRLKFPWSNKLDSWLRAWDSTPWQRLSGRLWLRSRWLRRAWPWTRCRHVVLLWDEAEQCSEPDRDLLIRFRQLAADDGCRLLVAVNVRDPTLVNTAVPALPPPYKRSFWLRRRKPPAQAAEPWVYMEAPASGDDETVPGEQSDADIRCQLTEHLFGERNPEVRNQLGADWEDKHFGLVDLPLLAMQISSPRLPLRYGVANAKAAYAETVAADFAPGVRPHLPEVMSGFGRCFAAEMLNDSEFRTTADGPVFNAQDTHAMRDRLPVAASRPGQWLWQEKHNVAGNVWQVYRTRPLYRAEMNRLLAALREPLAVTRFYAPRYAACRESYYLSLATGLIRAAESLPAETDPQKKAQGQAYQNAALALETAFEHQPLPDYPDAGRLRGEAVAAFLHSAHPEPERIAGLLLRCYDPHQPAQYPALQACCQQLQALWDGIWDDPLPLPQAPADDKDLAARAVYQCRRKLRLLIFMPEGMNRLWWHNFSLEFWTWFQAVPALAFPDEQRFFAFLDRFPPAEPEADKKPVFTPQETRQYQLFFDLWNNTPVSQAHAEALGAAAALMPDIALSTLTGCFKWRVLRERGMEECGDLSHGLAGLLKPFPDAPTPLPSLAQGEDFPWLPHWPAFLASYQQYRSALRELLNLQQRLPAALAGIGYALRPSRGGRIVMDERGRMGRGALG